MPLNSGFKPPLYMDNDDQMLGNSPGADLRGRLHVKVANKASEPIAVTFVESVNDEFFADATDIGTTPGVDQTLISFVVPIATQRQLSAVRATCRQEGIFWVLAGGLKIGSGLTGPGQPSSFSWTPARAIAAGVTIEVKFQERATGPVTTVDCFLMGADIAI